MPIHTILHKGLRANDVLIENDTGVLLTYYTHNRQEGIASDRVGLFLYKNQRVFANRDKAILWYMINEYKRWDKFAKGVVKEHNR